MNRLLVGRVLSLGLLVVVVVLALSACGGDEKKAKARPLPEDPKALRPGTYRSEEFKPSLSFHVGKGWSSSPLEASDILEIARGQTTGLNFNNGQEVYKPTKTGSANVVDAPKDMVGWLQQHPYLQTSKPKPVTVGGVKGVELDVLVDLPKDYAVDPECDPGECLNIAPLSNDQESAIFMAVNKRKVIVLEDVKGDTVMIWFAAPPDEFDEFAPEAQKVVDSVKWTGL